MLISTAALRVGLDGEQLFLVDTVTEQPVWRSSAASLVLGSGPDCDLLVEQASPRHAQLDWNEQGLILTDLGSEGGTFVNDRRIVRARLQAGDLIRLAPTQAATGSDGTWTFQVDPIPRPGGQALFSSGAEGLLQLSVALGRPGSLADKLDQILDYSLRLGAFDRAAIWVVDPDDPGEILFQRHLQAPGQPAPSISRTVLARVLAGHALTVTDAAGDTLVRHAMSVKMQNIRSFVALPLRTTDRIWGMLYLDCLLPQPLANPEEQKFLSGFACLAAVAVENAWLATSAQKQALLKERLSRFFPPTTVDTILEQPEGRLAGAVAPVTILFCDIRNYTGISFAQPPDRVAAWIDDYFSRIVPLVFAHGGTLEKYIGDAMLAIWGAPTSMSASQQALLACRAARDIHRAVADFATSWSDLPCQVGIGIHHGPAFVGTIGHDSYLQYAALGATTNLAARLCSAAGAGETILSRHLADLLPPEEFTSQPRPPVEAKGFPERVEVSVLSSPALAPHDGR